MTNPNKTLLSKLLSVGNILLSMMAFPGALHAANSIYIDWPGATYEGPGERALLANANRLGDTNTAVFVYYQTGTNGTATPGIDFQSVTVRLEFAPGEIIKQFTVPLLDDGSVEGPETVELLLFNPSPGATIDETPQFGVIIDDETPANLDYSFAPEFPQWPEINRVRIQSDGKILLSGSGLYLGGQEMRVMRLRADGSVDTSFRTDLTNLVSNIEVDSQGRILVATRDEYSRLLRLVRLFPNGAVDGAFSASLESLGEGYASLLPQTNGNVVLWNAGRLVRLRPEGSADAPFDLNVSGIAVRAVQQQADGKLLVARWDPAGTSSLIRLTADGSRDTGFQEPFFSTDCSVGFCVLSDDRIIIYGDPVLPGRKVIRLDRNGNLDPTFSEPPFREAQLPNSHCFYDLIGEANGKLYFKSRDRIVRLNSDGSLETSFHAEMERTSMADIGGVVLNAVLHQGAALLWNPMIQGVNRSIAPLARVLLDAGPDRAFAFSQDWRGTLKGPRVTANELDGNASIVVRRLGDTSLAASVDFATQRGSARPGVHFVSMTGSLTFAPMEAEKILTIPLIQDQVFNGIPSFFVVLSNPSVPARLDRPLQVGVRDREFGLVTGEILFQLDGSRQWQFDLAGADFRFEDYRNYRVERSHDLKSWDHAPTQSFGWTWWRRTPPSILLPTGQERYFYRARRD